MLSKEIDIYMNRKNGFTLRFMLYTAGDKTISKLGDIPINVYVFLNVPCNFCLHIRGQEVVFSDRGCVHFKFMLKKLLEKSSDGMLLLKYNQC